MTTIAVAVVRWRGRVLVGRRAADASEAAGCDEFPGGKVAPGEPPATAAVRECLEETGVAVRIDALLDRAEGSAGSGPLEILFFAATPLDPGAAPLAPFAWLPIEALATRRFPPANACVLARLAQGGS